MRKQNQDTESKLKTNIFKQSPISAWALEPLTRHQNNQFCYVQKVSFQYQHRRHQIYQLNIRTINSCICFSNGQRWASNISININISINNSIRTVSSSLSLFTSSLQKLSLQHHHHIHAKKAYNQLHEWHKHISQFLKYTQRRDEKKKYNPIE